MEENLFKPGDVVRHSFFTMAGQLLIIRKLGESTYGCRYFQGGQLLYTELEAFELERVEKSKPAGDSDVIVPS